MTNQDYQQEEDEANRREACYDTALDEFKAIIEPIKQDFEHYIDDTPINEVAFNVIKLMVMSVTVMTNKAQYHYVDDYDDIKYDFTDELKDMLLDEYGWKV